MSTSVENPHNPFRNRVTPTNTGNSNGAATASQSSLRPPAAPLQPEPTGQTAMSTAAPSFHTVDPLPSTPEEREHASSTNLRDVLYEEEDLPPAYTPGPAATEGETTLEFGPVRPFQNPPPQPVTQQFTGHLPPPRHPSLFGRHSTGDLNDDLYSPERRYTPPGGFPPPRHQPPPGRPPGSGYAPPPGRPPNATASGSGSGPSASRNTDRNADDGRPTHSPMPGHPLLRNNRALVYPQGYSCYKCMNTGFKSFDPSHPCRKCWERYSRPYEGPITYAPWGSREPGSVAANYQRPLPVFKTPQRTSWSGYPGEDYGPSSSSSGLARNLTVSHRGPPPPGSLVVQPGDPRIGGRLCWRCSGDGWVSFLIFDTETCPVCQGSGRTF